MKFALVFIFATMPMVAGAAVRVNEVAWMGTANSASDEWIELYSDSLQDLSGWSLLTADGGMNIMVSGTIAAGGYFLIERTDDTTVPDVAADLVAPFGSGLSNNGEILILKNAASVEMDKIDASGGWPAGDNSTKETMQRVGSGWITAAGTPKAGTVEDDSDTEESAAPPVSNGASSASALNSDAPRMSVDAGGDRAAVIGASIRFDGALYDASGAPIASADFFWGFGDGTTARGASVYHQYRFPGDYTVFLSGSYGASSITDRLTVRVIANGLAISEVKPGDDGWIEIANASSYALDLSGWGISNRQLTYSIPERTEIRAGARLVIAGETMNVDFPSSGAVYLLYPNGSPAHEWSYSGILKSDESFHFHDGAVKIGVESPGGDRFVFRQVIASTKSRSNNVMAVPDPESAKETAAVVAAKGSPHSFSWRAVGWFAGALGIGIVSALGYIALRMRGFL